MKFEAMTKDAQASLVNKYRQAIKVDTEGQREALFLSGWVFVSLCFDANKSQGVDIALAAREQLETILASPAFKTAHLQAKH